MSICLLTSVTMRVGSLRHESALGVRRGKAAFDAKERVERLEVVEVGDRRRHDGPRLCPRLRGSPGEVSELDRRRPSVLCRTIVISRILFAMMLVSRGPFAAVLQNPVRDH